MKRADVGIAMGGLGSDAAIEAAAVVLMDDDPRKIALAVKIARRTIHIEMCIRDRERCLVTFALNARPDSCASIHHDNLYYLSLIHISAAHQNTGRGRRV